MKVRVREGGEAQKEAQGLQSVPHRSWDRRVAQRRMFPLKVMRGPLGSPIAAPL
jgi:hypothetical protein